VHNRHASRPIWTHMAHSPFFDSLDGTSYAEVVAGNRSFINVSMLRSENYTPLSPADSVLLRDLSLLTDRVDALVSCAANALFKPNAHLVSLLAERVSRIPASHLLYALHIRTNDLEMAQRGHLLPARRLALSFRMRPTCRVGQNLITAIQCDLMTIPERSNAAEKGNVELFIGSDSSQAYAQVTNGIHRKLANVHIISSKGEPMHTGRKNASDAGVEKALLDFFMLTIADVYRSNCDFLSCMQATERKEKAPGSFQLWQPWNSSENIRRRSDHGRRVNLHCGNTFAANVWMIRALNDQADPIVRPRRCRN